MDEPKKKMKPVTRVLIAVLCVGVLAAGLVAFFWFFSLENVEVEGNVRYSDEEILDFCMGTPLSENTILFSVFARTINLGNIAFLDHATVEYIDPHTVKLIVSEKRLIGVFEIRGYYYYFDQDGRVTEVLTSPDEKEGELVPIVRGLGATNIGLEHIIEFEAPQALNTVSALQAMIDKYGICPDYVDFDADLNITLYYGEVAIQLGQDVLLEEKMARAAAILPNLAEYAGTLHLETFSQDTENIVFDIDYELKDYEVFEDEVEEEESGEGEINSEGNTTASEPVPGE